MRVNEDIEITYGTTDIIPSRRRYDTCNWYPSPYAEVRYYSMEEKEEQRRLAARVYDEAIRRAVNRTIYQQPYTEKRCERCKKVIQPQYRYCYRCNNYMKVKARIAS